MRLLAIAHTRHAKALEALVAEGEIRIYDRLDRKGNVTQVEAANLWLKIAQESEKFMVACYDRLGLTPLNRGKVKPADEPKKKPTLEEDFPSREDAVPAAEPEPDLNAIDEETIQ